MQTFTAESYEDALVAVRQALGPNARVVRRRDLPRGFSAPNGGVEIVAVASDDGSRYSRARDLGSVGLLARRLTRCGVPERAADALAASVGDLSGDRPLTPDALEVMLAAALEQEASFSGGRDPKQRIVGLIGPTGVGKTTTIAKLAAVESLVHGRRVGLVTVDHYRIGGAEQLQRYADLIGCPMVVANERISLTSAIASLGPVDVVFVDTSGRSIRDRSAQLEAARLMQGAVDGMELHLCLPVAMREAELAIAIEAYSLLSPSRLLFTKLDEAVYAGAIVAGYALSGLPLSYFTTGQRVPEDLYAATPAHLAGLLCGHHLD